MKISIIIATYNSESTIEKCLDSILNQSILINEILVIDGKSIDNTISIIKKRASQFNNVKIISEKDNGIYDALNKGVMIASGDIIGFVHSDDFLASSVILSEVVKKIISENLDGVYGDLNYVNKKNTNKIIRKWKSCEFNYSLLSNGWMPAHPTFFLKKEVYEKHGLFDLNYTISADYDFMLRVLLDNSLDFGYIPKTIITMRVGGVSNRNLLNIIEKSIQDYRIIKKNNVGGFLTLLRKNFSKIIQFLKT